LKYMHIKLWLDDKYAHPNLCHQLKTNFYIKKMIQKFVYGN